MKIVYIYLATFWPLLAMANKTRPANEYQDPSPSYHQNSRCVCKCPDVSTVKKEDNHIIDFEVDARRSVYISSKVTAQQCDCPNVVLPHLTLSGTEADSFCPRCKCNFQVRNLSVIKVIVILVIWVISILLLYMGYLSCVEPALNKRSAGIGYREQQNSQLDQDVTISDEDVDQQRSRRRNEREHESTQMRTYGNSVFNRVGNQQNKWKRQVQEQRRNIYDRHTMLN